MQIQHFDNGDSEYTLKVIVRVGATDKYGSTVTIGNLPPYTIYESKIDNKWYICDNNDRWIAPPHGDKWQCVDWLVNQLEGK